MAGAVSFLPVVESHPVLDSKDAAVSIATNGNVMNINSTATNNVIKWVDFSISQGKTVDFHDKNYLNYVTGHARSDIYGILKGTGNIYLVNPNGILIGDTARIDVGSLYLSTRNLTDEQLASYSAATGALFKNDSAALGEVINLGKLDANIVTVEGTNITFKNVEDVTKGGTLSGSDITGGTKNTDVNMAASGGEIHIGSADGAASGYTIASGTEIDYKLINNVTELQDMQNDLSGNYMLAGNIEAGGLASFTPVGYGWSDSFTGRFDGLDYEIRNLKVSGTSGQIGLFGRNEGTIENLAINGIEFSYGDGSYAAGSIAAYNWDNGKIRNVRNIGTVTLNPTGSNGDLSTIGGIVGSNIGTIEKAYNTADISATNVGSMGGIAGISSGTISNVFNSGKLTATPYAEYFEWKMGGIVGQMGDGTLTNAYNVADLSGSGNFYVGGIVGYLQNATVANTYNTGSLSSNNSDWIGGIAGAKYEGSINNSYATAYTQDETDEWGTQVTAAELKNKTTFTDWNVDQEGSAWRMGSNGPLLTAFLTRKDKVTESIYDGTADAGTNYGDTMPALTDVEQTGAKAINYVQNVSIIKQKDLTVTFGNTTKVYDGTTDATAGEAGALTGLVGSDDVSLGDVTAVYDNKNAGEGKTVYYTAALTGTKAKNYNLASATGTGTITPKTLTATFADVSKTYDGGTDVATPGAGTLTDVLDIDSGKVSVAAASGTYADKNVGTNITVNYTGVALSGTEAGNYTIDSAGTGKGAITRKALSLVADNVVITEGQETPATFTGKVTGFVENEGLADGDAASFAIADPAPTAVGSYAVTGTLNGQTSGDYGDNYTFDNAAANATAFRINAKSNSDPVNPDPVNPDPVNPDPVNPAPVNPDPVNPDPVNPGPVNPDPVNPDPVNPDPVNPNPALPDGLTMDTITEEENMVSSLADEDRKEAKYIAEAAQGEAKPDSHISAAENSIKVEGAMSEEEFAHQQYVLQHPEEAEGSGE